MNRERPMPKRLIPVALAVVAIAASCTSGPGRSDATTTTAAPATTSSTTEPLPPEVVLVIGPAGDGADEGAVELALSDFAAENGIPIQYVAHPDPSREYERRVSRDEPGDIFLVDSVAVVADAAVNRTARVVPRSVDIAVSDTWSSAWTRPARLGDALFAVPLDSEIDSLLWYQPELFDELGYRIPRTWNQLVDLATEIRRDDLVPFCGFPDEAARDEAFVDWTFDLLIRSHEISVYDEVLAETRDYDTREVFDIWTAVRDLWITRDVGFGFPEPVEDEGDDEGDTEGAVVPVRDPVAGLVTGECLMVRGGVDVARRLPADTRYADGTASSVDVAIFPGPRGNVPAVADVTYALSRRDRPEVWALMRYLGSADFADDRRALQVDTAVPDFQSAAGGQDLFPLDLLELSLLDVMATVTESRERWDEVVPTIVRIRLLEEARLVANGQRRIGDAMDSISDAW